MDTIQASTGQANKIHPFEQYYVIPVMFPVLTSSGKVLYQAFKTRRPYLRSQVYLKPSMSAGSPKDFRAHNTPSVMSCSVVNDWDQICLPEETFLLGQSWEFMGPEWRCKSSKEKKKEIKKKHHSFFEGMAIIYQSIIEWSQGFQGFIVKGHYDTAKLPGHAWKCMPMLWER